MNADKIKLFMQLAGQELTHDFRVGTEGERKLGAQLLLSEVLEYVVKGLGVHPVVDGVRIEDADSLQYEVSATAPHPIEMLDGLADTAYTMFWNACAFGIPLESAFEQVCENNLSKFVRLENDFAMPGSLPKPSWHCGQRIQWPEDVVRVDVLKVDNSLFAVGKDARGKVRKPSSYQPVDLSNLVRAA